MRTLKVFSFGEVKNRKYYLKLQEIERKNPNWLEYPDEFKSNREWWVIIHKEDIIAYCGHAYVQHTPTNHYVYFTRAWVKREYRGKGLQKKLINLRLRSAKKLTNSVITYTMIDNYASINSLISCGFRLYCPEYQYIDGDVLYFIKHI